MTKLEKKRCQSGEEQKLHFDFAGKFFEESEKEFFFNYIKDNALEDFVTYHGVVSGDKKCELLKKCDIFTLLTTYPNEGQPISILEAMGNGMMIVTTNHAGIPDIVKDGVSGIVVDKNSILTTELYKHIINSATFKGVAIKNRLDIQELYNQEKYIENMAYTFVKGFE